MIGSAPSQALPQVAAAHAPASQIPLAPVTTATPLVLPVATKVAQQRLIELSRTATTPAPAKALRWRRIGLLPVRRQTVMEKPPKATIQGLEHPTVSILGVDGK